jgi:hypothetical protein
MQMQLLLLIGVTAMADDKMDCHSPIQMTGFTPTKRAEVMAPLLEKAIEFTLINDSSK